MCAHVADELDNHAPLGELPLTIDQMNAIVIRAANHRRECATGSLMQHRDVRPCGAACLAVVHIDDHVGDDVPGAWQSVVGANAGMKGG